MGGGTRSYFHNEKPQILCAAIHNLVAQDLCTASPLNDDSLYHIHGT